MEVLFFIAIMVWLVSTTARKFQGATTAQKQKSSAQPQRERVYKQQPAQVSQTREPKMYKPASPVGSLGEYTPMQSSEGRSAYKPIEHRLDTSLQQDDFVGSLGVGSTEGMDICDPSLEHGREIGMPSNMGYEGMSGAQPSLYMDSRALLQGVIMNEILTRPSQRKWGKNAHG